MAATELRSVPFGPPALSVCFNLSRGEAGRNPGSPSVVRGNKIGRALGFQGPARFAGGRAELETLGRAVQVVEVRKPDRIPVLVVAIEIVDDLDRRADRHAVEQVLGVPAARPDPSPRARLAGPARVLLGAD